MPSFQPNFASNFDEKKWVIHICQTLEEELEENTETPVSIFNVPKALLAIHPLSYIPHQVAIGPYHYWHPELSDMERYKLLAAKRNQKELKSFKLQKLVDQLIPLEHKIRASYSKILNIGGETLAWMMAVDASFLLEFLQVCGVKESSVLTKDPIRLAYLVGLGRNKLVHNTILRDVVMLENQIPLLVMRKMLEQQFPSIESADEFLHSMLVVLWKELSPFKRAVEDLPKIQLSKCAHLLDFLYQVTVPKSAQTLENHEAVDQSESKEEEEDDNFFHKVWNVISGMFKKIVGFIMNILSSRPIKFIVTIPWKIISNMPVLKALKEPLENIFSSFADEESEKKDEENSGPNISPLLEEITIPSVTKLVKSGVTFCPTNGDITSISFDTNTVTLYLPTISLDVNSDVVLRNLVAYEACIGTGPLVLARYMELMNGIIDTEEDAKVLRERRIIVNRLKSDEEVAQLWNGMSKSIRLTKVPFLDKVIEDVNKYHSGRWKVKVGKFMRSYVFGSWKLLTFLAAILMILLMGLQAFCSVYSCSSYLNTVTN